MTHVDIDLDGGFLLLLYNAFAGSVHAIALIVTLSIANLELSPPLYKSNFTIITSNTTTHKLLLSDPREVGGLNLTACTAVFFGVTALSHFGNVFLWRRLYLNEIAACRNVFRWIEYSISTPAMTLVIAYSCGLVYLTDCITISALFFSVMMLGLAQEVYNRPSDAGAWRHSLPARGLLHVMGYVPYAAAWAVIFISFDNVSSSPSDDGGSMPSFVYAIVGTQFVMFSAFAVTQVAQILSPPSAYLVVEFAYISLSLTSKLILGCILLAYVLTLEDYDSEFG